MANSLLKDGYTAAFPASWSSGSQAASQPIVERKDSNKRQLPLPRSGDLPDADDATIVRENIANISDADNIQCRDFAYPPPGRSEPAGEPGCEGIAGTDRVPTPATALPKVVKPRTKIIKSRPDEDSYSTVYPSSWTIRTTGEVAPTKPPSPRALPPMRQHAPVLLQHVPLDQPREQERTQSTSSQGDVMPRSPVKRRLQKEFWSLSVPKTPQPYVPRSWSADLGDGHNPKFSALLTHELQRERRVSKAPRLPEPLRRQTPFVAASPVTPPQVEEHSRFSQTSGYSTIYPPPGQQRTSQADTPARSRKNVLL